MQQTSIFKPRKDKILTFHWFIWCTSHYKCCHVLAQSLFWGLNAIARTATSRSELLFKGQKKSKPKPGLFLYNHCASQIKGTLKKQWHGFKAKPSINHKDFNRSPPLFSYRMAPTIKNIVTHGNMVQDKTTCLKATCMYRYGNCACCNKYNEW